MAYMFGALIGFVAAALIIAAVGAKPAIPGKKKTEPAPKKAEPKLPDLTGETNWGKLDQKGRDFTITGGSIWVASGHIRKDGKAELTWTRISDGADCPAVYEIVDAEGKLMVGHYGYSEAGAFIDEQGVLQGQQLDETIWRTKK